jgi:hypothetical protein
MPRQPGTPQSNANSGEQVLRMSNETEKDAVVAAYQAYTRAFLDNDMDAIDGLVRYPVAYIADGKTLMLDSYPVKPADLIAQKQWYSTADTDFEVVGISADKAHVILPRARRLRADGSLIETVSAFYAFTRTDDGWKIFALSDITVQAGNLAR